MYIHVYVCIRVCVYGTDRCVPVCICVSVGVCVCVQFVCHLFLTRGAQKSSSQDARRPPSAPAGAQGLRAKAEGTEYMYGLYIRSL